MLKRFQRWLWRITGAQEQLNAARLEAAYLRQLCLQYGVATNPVSIGTVRGFERAVDRFCRDHLPIACQARVRVTEDPRGLVDVAVHVERRSAS